MTALLSRLGKRLRQRPDSEHEQALVRLAIALVIVAYLLSLQHSGEKAGPMLLVMVAESFVGQGLLAAIVVSVIGGIVVGVLLEALSPSDRR
jgi:two-component system sensor histidine kinase RpfC